MKTYKVVALSLGSKSGKIFNGGDIVKEDAFEEGIADQLVKQDFLIEVNANTKPGIVTEEDKAKTWSAQNTSESGALATNMTADAAGEMPAPLTEAQVLGTEAPAETLEDAVNKANAKKGK